MDALLEVSKQEVDLLVYQMTVSPGSRFVLLLLLLRRKEVYVFALQNSFLFFSLELHQAIIDQPVRIYHARTPRTVE